MAGTHFAAVAPGGGDVAYRTQGLQFTPIELELDESVSWKSIFQLFILAVIVSFLVWVTFFFFGLLMGLFVSNSGTSFQSVWDVMSGIFLLSWLVATVTFWLVFLLYQMDEPLSEWKTLLEDKAGASTSAYAAIYGTMTKRRFPLYVTAVRVRSDLLVPEAINSRLVVTERSYQMYLSVFPYGTSLYVGWTMWRRRRGAVLVGHFVKDLVGGFIGRSGSVNQALRTETIRAMREAVHAAVREGIEVAMSGANVPLGATFGYDLPVQDLRSGGAAPAPAPIAPHSPSGRPGTGDEGPTGAARP